MSLAASPPNRLPAQRHAAWMISRERALRRRHILESATRVLSLHVLAGVLVLQARHLLHADSAFGAVFPITVLASLLTFDVLLLTSPTAMLGRLEWFLRRSVLGLLRAVSGALLLLVYVLLFPVNVTFARRAHLRRRPEQAAWFADAPWQVSTWTHKRSEAIVAEGGRRPRLITLLMQVHSGGGTYLVLLTLLVLLALTLNVAAGSAKLAPFTYTLF